MKKRGKSREGGKPRHSLQSCDHLGELRPVSRSLQREGRGKKRREKKWLLSSWKKEGENKERKEETGKGLVGLSFGYGFLGHENAVSNVEGCRSEEGGKNSGEKNSPSTRNTKTT